MTFNDKLEPEAVAAADANEHKGGTLTVEECAALSAAISAKRQADATERVAEAVEQLARELADPEWGIGPAIRAAARK